MKKTTSKVVSHEPFRLPVHVVRNGQQRLIKCLAVIGSLLLIAVSDCAAFSTVVIDAGHGGHDRGGIPGQRISEKTMTLDVARRLRSILSEAGVRTVMTRNNDSFIPLGTRAAMGNAQRDAIFVSVHFNSGSRRGARGFETYYYSNRSASLATAIHSRVNRQTWRTENRGLRRRGFFVIRKTRIPAVLVECGFLTNPGEGSTIQQPANRQMLAQAIASGILSRR